MELHALSESGSEGSIAKDGFVFVFWQVIMKEELVTRPLTLTVARVLHGFARVIQGMG